MTGRDVLSNRNRQIEPRLFIRYTRRYHLNQIIHIAYPKFQLIDTLNQAALTWVEERYTVSVNTSLGRHDPV